MRDAEFEYDLSIVVTVTDGKKSLRDCLRILCAQAENETTEIIVPYDKWSCDVAELATEFPQVNFHRTENLGKASSEKTFAHQHRLYDRRRAIGLQLARGRIVAMTEDRAIPEPDWCRKILEAHRERANAIIGGAIENRVDAPLNWAWYYCDYGRYGRPFADGAREYVSDVNIAYKRKILEETRQIWQEEYRETILHRAMRTRGAELFLDQRMVVFQNRSQIKFAAALRERFEWGRVFAETRVAVFSLRKRMLFSVGTLLLPPILLRRVWQNMRRQQRSAKQIFSALPLALLLLIAWSFGELAGYLVGLPETSETDLKITEKAAFPH